MTTTSFSNPGMDLLMHPTNTGLTTSTSLTTPAHLPPVEELRKTTSLFTSRLGSRQLNQLIVPIVYRHVNLQGQLIPAFFFSSDLVNSTVPKLPVAHHMCLYTQHVSITKALDLISLLRNLRYITWSYWNPNVPSSVPAFTKIFQDIRTWAPNVKFHIEQFTAVPSQLAILKPLLPDHVLSFKTLKRPFVIQNSSILRGLMQQNGRLETLHLIASNKNAAIMDQDIRAHDRMPPIKELLLQKYFWTHSAHVAVNFWNWSKLVHLELKVVPIINFLQTVKPENLVQLRAFLTDGHCLGRSQRKEATVLICSLVSRIQALETLSITCNILGRACISAIEVHGPNLNSLELRNYFELTSPRYKIPWSKLLVAIQSSCPQLMTLTLDYPSHTNKSTILQGIDATFEDTTLAMFRNLRRLTLLGHNYHISGAMASPNIYDMDYTAVRGWLQGLLLAKQGARFEKVIVYSKIWMAFGPGIYVCPWLEGRAEYFYEGKSGFHGPELGATVIQS